jgi:aspartate aminotransferase
MGSIQQSSSLFAKAEYIPADAIFEVTKHYLADTDSKKVNLGQGTYRDENGKPWVLPSVRMATEQITGCGHEYLPIAGLSSFRQKAVELVFQETKAFQEGRVCSRRPKCTL